MAGGPLHWFRKNQKILLVVFGVLLMIVFTVGGVLDSFFSGQSQGGSPVRKVASSSFGDFTNKDMDEFAEGNRRAAEFTFELYRLSKDPLKAKAVPISPLNDSTTESRDRDILSRLAFAEFAKENGMYVGEEILNDYFNMLCNNELANVNKTVEQFSRELQKGSLSTVKAHLKTELLARCGQQMISAGVNPQYSQQGFLVGVSPTPVEIWEGHRRLRERFKIEYMTLDIASPDSIDDEPSNEEMKKLYEEGMDRAPNIAIGPGFKKPRLATVAYFAVNRESFDEKEKAKITEEEIQAKYQEWVSNEDFRVIDTTDLGPIDGGNFVPNKSDSNDPSKDDSKDGKKDDGKSDQEPKLNSPSNDSTKKEGGKEDGAKQDGAPKSDPDQSKGGKTGEGDKKNEQSNFDLPQDSQLVSLIQEKDAAPQKNEAPKGTGTEKAKGENVPANNNQTAPNKQDDGKSAPKQDGKQDDAKKDAPDSVPPNAVQQDKEKDKPKIKPLDDKIRDLIRTDLARPKSLKAVEEAQESVRQVVADYLNDYDYYSENPDEKDYLEVPDFEALAKEHGLEYKEFEQVDYLTLSKTDFGRASVVPTDNRQQAGPVAQEIFFTKFQSRSNFEINDTRPVDGLEYMFWVVDRKFREKVSFEDAKPKIIEYYKKVKAIEAAEAEAKKIIDEVSSSNRTLLAVYGDKVKTSREFGWMELDENMERMAESNPRIVQQMPQFFMPKMGQIIPEKPDDAEAEEGVNHLVMAKIFALEENEFGFAADSRRDRVFIFRVTERTKANPIQKDSFFVRSKFGTAQSQSQLDQGPELTDILSAMDLLEKYSVKWFGERENE